MKKILLLICLFLTTVCKVSATVQTKELIVINGDTLQLHSQPLYEYLPANDLKNYNIPGLGESLSTACWRGYIGIWLIENDKLYLTEIRHPGYKGNKITADLSELFGER